MVLQRLKTRALKIAATAIALGIGFPLLTLTVVQSKELPKVEDEEKVNKSKKWKTRFYRVLPWRTMSRTWGSVCNLNVPKWTCNGMVSWYVKTWDVNLSEAERENIQDYSSLGDLFRRKLKPGARPIDPLCPLVSPCDGKVLIHGRVEDNGELEQVKGLSYNLFNFLGSPSWNKKSDRFLDGDIKNVQIPNSVIKRRPDSLTSLFYIVIYLAPGDYHRYHSPANWRIFFRRHFRGELLSVSPTVAKWVQDLLTLNERVVYIGQWTYGFFSMVPVGKPLLRHLCEQCFETSQFTILIFYSHRCNQCGFDYSLRGRGSRYE